MNADLVGKLLTHEQEQATLGTLQLLGAAIAKRDCNTAAHNCRVASYAVRLARLAGLTTPAIQSLVKGAFLHDVGKIAIADGILFKPGKLDADEYAVMQTHVQHGVDILSKVAWLDDAVEVVRCHHERFDGSGYPAGLRGEAISASARVLAIADSFDAIVSRRPYQEGLPLQDSLRVLADGDRRSSADRGHPTGGQGNFDPHLLALFLRHAPAWYAEIAAQSDSAILAGMPQQLADFLPAT